MFITIPGNPRVSLTKSKTVKRREQRKRQSMRNMPAAEVQTVLAYNVGQSGAKTPPVRTKVENTMYVDYISSDKHLESAKTNYLLQRALSVKSNLRNGLYKQFGLQDDTPPANPIELVARITDGQYVLPTEKEAQLGWPYNTSALNGIKWRNPKIIEDRAGYKAADKELETAFQTVQDAAMIGTPADALTAVQSFEKWTTTVVPATTAAA